MTPALCTERAAGIRVHHLSSRTHSLAEALDAAICQALVEEDVDVVVLAGYMKKLGPGRLFAFAAESSTLTRTPSEVRRQGMWLNVDPYTPEGGVGRVRHLYVLSAFRRRGVGGRLIAAVIEAARGRFGELRLRTGNPEAARVYEAIGFQPSGRVADCTHIMELR